MYIAAVVKLAKYYRDVHYVQHLLGHRHVTMTMRYFHLSQTRVLATGSTLDLLEPPGRPS